MTFLVIDGTIHWLSISNLFLKKKSLKLKDASALLAVMRNERILSREKKRKTKEFSREAKKTN